MILIVTVPIHIYTRLVSWPILVEGDPKAPFSIATTPKCREGATPFPELLHLLVIRNL